jgi:ABC-type antimicrobial peptide transport system permease subunit
VTIFLTYLRCELRHRPWQAVITGVGLAVGTGLVITVSATTSGVKIAQASALHALASSVGADPGGTPGNLPGVVNDAIASSAGLAADLGTWVAVAALAAAFTLAALLTLAGVTRRVTEFGTLKALGWRAGRITAQVLGEAAAVGISGALAGVGLGFAGAALVTALGPTLTVTVIGTASAGGPQDKPVPVPFSAPVSPGIVALAVALGVAGGLLAGALGGWRAARLRPAAALTQVG